MSIKNNLKKKQEETREAARRAAARGSRQSEPTVIKPAVKTAAQKAQEAIDTVVAAQGPGIVYMSDAGEFFVLQEG